MKYSVAMCTYNGEKYITEQLNSIIEQTILPEEIIISDDGSSDATLVIADNLLKKSKIKYSIVTNDKLKGVTGNFCNAISLCSSEVVFTSDQDDVWNHQKAEKLLNIFEEKKDVMLVFTDGELVDSNLNSLGCSMWKSVGMSYKIFEEGKMLDRLLNRCLVTGATMAFRKTLFDENEIMPPEWLHDGWLAWKAASLNGLYPCDDKLILYRQHGNNVVGMSGVSLIKKIKSYVINIKRMKYVHENKYKRFKILESKLGIYFEAKQQEKLHECVSFWEKLTVIDKEKNILKKLCSLFKLYHNKYFDKYFNGFKGLTREVIVVFFSKEEID